MTQANKTVITFKTAPSVIAYDSVDDIKRIGGKPYYQKRAPADKNYYSYTINSTTYSWPLLDVYADESHLALSALLLRQYVKTALEYEYPDYVISETYTTGPALAIVYPLGSSLDFTDVSNTSTEEYEYKISVKHPNGFPRHPPHTETQSSGYFIRVFSGLFQSTLKDNSQVDTDYVFNVENSEDGISGDNWDSTDSPLIENGYRDDPKALVYIKQADYATSYKVHLNGVECSITTPEATTDNARAGLDTLTLTNSLLGAINSTGGHNCVASLVDQTILILPTVSTNDFTFSVTDSLGGRALLGFKYLVKDIADLPASAPYNYPLKVIGDPDQATDAYHIKFVSDASSSKGIWEETVAPSLNNDVNTATMPHMLVRKQAPEHITADNPLGIYFEFKEAPWSSRKVGDLDTAPLPSFVSKQDEKGDVLIARKIRAMGYFKNRLTFATNENLVCSEAGSYFNFFPTTVITALDSDPIDVSINSADIVDIKHLQATQEELLLFSDRKQLVCKGGDVFSNETIQIAPTTSYAFNNDVTPVASGNSIYFLNKRRNFSAVWEYFNKGDGISWDAQETTAHVPNYIPKEVSKVVASTDQNTLFVLPRETTQGSHYLYIYNYHVQGDEKVQAAWHKWEFTGRIIDISISNSTLHLVTQYDNQYVMEEINLKYDQLREVIGHPLYLDNRREITGETPPVLAEDDPRRILTYNGRTYIGYPYTQLYKFSRLFLRKDSRAIVGGRTQAKRLTLAYADSSHFKVDVAVQGITDKRIMEFNGRTLGAISNIIGSIPIASGEFNIPLLSRTDKLEITILNDSVFDARFQSALLEMFHYSRHRRI